MSAPEPTKIGTVVTLPEGRIAIRARTTDMGLHWVVQDRHGTWLSWAEWHDLDNPVVVHEGYAPPTPEPTLPLAVVRTASRYVLVRIDDGEAGPYWMHDDGSGRVDWSHIDQPVEVLFEGVAQ